MSVYTILQTTPYPVYEIDLSKLNEAADISWIMKTHGVTYYVYTFEYQGKTIKHGISVDQKSSPGDRIYRQAGHLEGWKHYRLRGSNGNDMRLIDAAYYAKNGEHLNRLGMKIIVRDLTNMPSPSLADKTLHVKQLERQLIKEYEDQNNCLPIGNIKNESYIDHKTYVTKDTWDKLFDFQ